MPTPYFSFVHEGYSVPLTKIAAGYSPVGLVGDKVFPFVTHVLESGKIPIFGKDSFKIYDTTRAMRAETNFIRRDPGEWKPFQCEEHDLAEAIDYRELQAIAKLPAPGLSYFNLQKRATARLQWNMALEREKSVASTITDTATYPVGHYETLSGTDQWTDYANSDPIVVIEDSKEVVRSAIGREPNSLLIGAKTWNTLKFHPKYLDKLSLTKDKKNSAEFMKAEHELDNIFVGKTMAVDKDGAFVDLWGDFALLFYLPQGGTPEIDSPCFAYSIRPETRPGGYPYADIYTKENGKLVIVRNTDCYTSVVVFPHAAYLISDASG